MNEKKQLNYEQAKDKALRLLGFRAHSEKELKEKLLRAGAMEEDIEKILDFCREYKFVDDRGYAVRKAKDLYNLKKLGKNRIRQELNVKGIPSEYIDEALEQVEFDTQNLLPLVKKRLGGDFEKKNRDKCIRYFLYRGYSLSEIKDCIEQAQYENE
ncbi:MAG: regulatory protein RecX [Clostridiales bacterium]|nr:regulatory protein RecX [Clostridiales bacterium]